MIIIVCTKIRMLIQRQNIFQMLQAKECFEWMCHNYGVIPQTYSPTMESLSYQGTMSNILQPSNRYKTLQELELIITMEWQNIYTDDYVYCKDNDASRCHPLARGC